MSTDFYERQYQARRTTKWLVVLFVLGLVSLVGATMALGWAAVNGFDFQKSLDPNRLSLAVHGGVDKPLAAVPLGAGAATLALIGLGTLYKTAQLAGGGHVVAESLGGVRLFPDSNDPVERRVLNVVEEMALASGVPTPPVFILRDEGGINAFAAGYSPSDAVVTVTRGAAESLTRDELQGVIAHEFSHILNGDMRLNIRLIGILHGILLLGLIGRILVRIVGNSSGRVRRSSGDKKGSDPTIYLVLIGLALIVIGFLGTLFGNLIKAAVSRQREYLADASAVQFTRNPGGLAGALMRIMAWATGSTLSAPSAAEASHMFFATGVWEGLTSLTATHPPLKQRILRLDPQWNGVLPEFDAVAVAAAAGERAAMRSESRLAGVAALAGAAGAAGAAEELPVRVVARAADQVGDPQEAHRRYAAALVASLPDAVKQAAREPYGSRAVVLGLLADRNPEVREKQLQALAQLATPDLVELTVKLLPALDGLDVKARLPLVDLALPALRAMSRSQYAEFLKCFKALVAADQRLGLFEWTLHRILLRHLQPQYEKTAAPQRATGQLSTLGQECSVLLSTLAHADNRTAEAAAAVERGAACLPGVGVVLLPPNLCGLEPLRKSLDALAAVPAKQRRHVVNACAATICADREVTVAEAELLRGVCDMLDCPMPPLLPGGPARPASDEAA